MLKKYEIEIPHQIITYLEEKDSIFHASVKSNLSRLSDDDEVYISVLTLYEMHYGIAFVKEDLEKYEKRIVLRGRPFFNDRHSTTLATLVV